MSYSFRPRELIAQSHSTAKYFEAINAKQAADDLKRVRLLESLKASAIKFTSWERGFIDDQLARRGAVPIAFSKAQCAAIDRLHHLYGKRVL